jgi:hypothetical protein
MATPFGFIGQNKFQTIKSMSPKQKPESIGFLMSKGSRIETADSRFIRLLTFISQAGGTVSTDETDSPEDVLAYAELCAGGFISAGEVGRDGSGCIGWVTCMEITISGRTYLAELQHKAEMNTSVGIIKHNRFKFYWWFLGTVGAVYLAYRVGLWVGLNH